MNRSVKSVVFLCLFLLILICTIVPFVTKKREIDQQCPDAVVNLIENYLEAYKQGTQNSSVFIHFEDDFSRSAYLDSNDYLIDYKIESIERINKNLYEVTLQIMTELTQNYFGDKPQFVYNFACRIYGKWWYINGVRHIPPNLQSGLDDTKYSYTDPNTVDPGDILRDLPFTP